MFPYFDFYILRPSFDFQRYYALDGEFIRVEFEQRQGAFLPLVISGLFIAMSWVLLTIPITQTAHGMSNGGKRKLWLHTSIVILALAGSLTEFVARLMHVGSYQACAWIARKFELDSWAQSNDELGWKTLELVYRAAGGIVKWVDAFEYLILFFIFTLNFISVQSLNSTLRRIFSIELASFGLFIGLLSLAEFSFIVLKMMENNRALGLAIAFLSAFNRIVLIPGYLVALGFCLPTAIMAHKDQMVLESAPKTTVDYSEADVVTDI